MPKQRSSNSVGNRDTSSGGAGGGVGGPEGLADLLNNRLDQDRTVTVEMPSRTRGQTEELEVTFTGGSGVVQVTSASGNTYHVDTENNTCDCPHHQHRQENCRHMDAVEQAQGSNPELREMTNAVDVDEQIPEVANRDYTEEEARRALSGNREDDGVFYSDDLSAMETRMAELRDQDVPYDYANALNGSNVTFGLELEFVDGDSDAIARELHELGIVGHPRMIPYRGQGVPGKWKLERDGSVTSGRRGGELVSPVLRDTPETWRNLDTICEVARRHGARVSTATGGHIHVGMEPLDTARQRWRRFFNTIKGNEEAVFNFSGGDLGRFRGGIYAGSFTREAADGASRAFSMDDMYDVRSLARSVQSDRYRGVNLMNLAGGRQDTVEFRYFNGSLTPGQIQANVKLSVGMMHASEQSRTQQSDEFHVSEANMRRGNMIKNGDNAKNTASIARLIDIAFTRERDREHALSVFSKNTWRR